MSNINRCIFCNESGEILYKNIRDNIFGVPGCWNLIECKNCGLIWLNPFPSKEELDAFHMQYKQFDSKIFDGVFSFRKKIKNSLIASNFISTEKVNIKYSKFLTFIFKFISFAKSFGDRIIMYIPKSNSGKLLDIGCGEGDFLMIARDLGWQVTGVEQDRRSVELAKNIFNLDLINKKFEETKIQKNYFDVVTADNVIEHVKDPTVFLVKAFSLVKPGGKLIIATPNVGSLGHRVFKRNWRHLFSPRHLFLYSKSSLVRCAIKSGIKSVKIRFSSISATLVFQNSASLIINGKSDGGLHFSFFNFIPSFLFQIIEILLCFFKPSLGEEVILEATKK